MNDTFKVTPKADYFGNITVLYDINDGDKTTTGKYNLTIKNVNDAPTITPITGANIDEDTSTKDITVKSLYDTASDIDSPASSLTISNIRLSTVNDNDKNATLKITDVNKDNNIMNDTFKITPKANYNGNIVLLYDINDGDKTTTGTYNLTINSVQDAPIVSDIDIARDSTKEEEPKTITYTKLLEAVSDADGDSLNITNIKLASGKATIDKSVANQITVTPTKDFNGDIIISYDVDDGHKNKISTSFKLVVDPVNDAPIANDDTIIGIGSDTYTINFANHLLNNDTDVDSNNLSVTVIQLDDSSKGTLSNIDYKNGTADFKFKDGFTEATLQYVLSDGSKTDTANIKIDSLTFTADVAHDTAEIIATVTTAIRNASNRYSISYLNSKNELIEFYAVSQGDPVTSTTLRAQKWDIATGAKIGNSSVVDTGISYSNFASLAPPMRFDDNTYAILSTGRTQGLNPWNHDNSVSIRNYNETESADNGVTLTPTIDHIDQSGYNRNVEAHLLPNDTIILTGRTGAAAGPGYYASMTIIDDKMNVIKTHSENVHSSHDWYITSINDYGDIFYSWNATPSSVNYVQAINFDIYGNTTKSKYNVSDITNGGLHINDVVLMNNYADGETAMAKAFVAHSATAGDRDSVSLRMYDFNSDGSLSSNYTELVAANTDAALKRGVILVKLEKLPDDTYVLFLSGKPDSGYGNGVFTVHFLDENFQHTGKIITQETGLHGSGSPIAGIDINNNGLITISAGSVAGDNKDGYGFPIYDVLKKYIIDSGKLYEGHVKNVDVDFNININESTHKIDQLVIEDIPNGFTFSHGTLNQAGTILTITNPTKADLDALTFTAGDDYHGDVTFKGKITISLKSDASQTIITEKSLSFTIASVDDKTVIGNDHQIISSTNGNDITITKSTLLSNDSDVDSNSLIAERFTLIDNSHGTLDDNNDGTLTFSPSANLNAIVKIGYFVKDGDGGITYAELKLSYVNEIDFSSGAETKSGTNNEIDHFIFDNGDGNDTINNFEDNTDKIDLSNYTKTGNTKIKFDDLTFNQSVDGDVVITGFNSGDQLIIDNVAMNKINADDFIFG